MVRIIARAYCLTVFLPEGGGVMGIFRPGDRVRYKKNAPVMEVKGYDKSNRVVCSWYETHAGWTRDAFDEVGLRRVRRGRAPKPAPAR